MIVNADTVCYAPCILDSGERAAGTLGKVSAYILAIPKAHGYADDVIALLFKYGGGNAAVNATRHTDYYAYHYSASPSASWWWWQEQQQPSHLIPSGTGIPFCS